MKEITVTHSLTRSPQATFVVLLLFDVIHAKKFRFLSFYLLNAHENESSFAWMTSYNDRTTEVTRSDLMSDGYFFHPYCYIGDILNSKKSIQQVQLILYILFIKIIYEFILRSDFIIVRRKMAKICFLMLDKR
jgi:hypothetical protein